MAGGAPPPGEAPPFPSDGLPPAPDTYNLEGNWPIVLDKLLEGPGSEDEAREFSRSLAITVDAQLEELFEHFAIVTLRLLAQRPHATADDVMDWASVLARMGYSRFVEREIMELHREWEPWYGFPVHYAPFGTRNSKTILRGLLFRIPDPIEKMPAISLGDTLTSMLGNRARIASLSFTTFAVLLFAAAAVVATAGSAELPFTTHRWTRDLRQRAAAWLFRHLPSVPEDSTAGEALGNWSP